jgi:site-specific DNA recombinase
MADLRRQEIVTKRRTLKTGKTVGGIPFARGALAYLLRNRFYIGEVAWLTAKGRAGAIVRDVRHLSLG